MKEKSKQGLADFAKLCTQIENPEDLLQLFDLFFTIEEKETLAQRYLIVEALLKGELTQREISEKMKVSIAQITRGSNAMKIIDDKLKDFLRNTLSS